MTGLGSIIWKISFIENRWARTIGSQRLTHTHSRTNIRTRTRKHWYHPSVIARWTEAIQPAFRGRGRAEEQSEGKFGDWKHLQSFVKGETKIQNLNDSDDSLCSDSSGWILILIGEKGYVSFCFEREQKRRICEPKMFVPCFFTRKSGTKPHIPEERYCTFLDYNFWAQIEENKWREK